jgi:HK97 gp10 family phage protein
MSKGFRISTEGFKSLEKRLEKMSKDAVNEVSDVVDKHIFDINREQVSLTRVDTGYLKNSNDFDVQDKKYKEIFNNANYAAFIEFGTGKGVNVPTELQQYARQFKGKGIRNVNLPARPFFFAPFFKRRQAILRDIVKVLQKFGK